MDWMTGFVEGESIQAIQKVDYWPFWVPVALLISCFFIVLVRFIHPGYFNVLNAASWRNINIDLYAREDLSNARLSGFLLHINYVLISATIVTIAFWNEFISMPVDQSFPWTLLLVVAGAFTTHMLFRYLMLGIVRVLSQVHYGIIETIYNFKVSTEMTSVLLTVLLIIHFAFRFDGAVLQYVFFSVIGFTNLVYWGWSIRHTRRNNISWFYLFLYLCTLEILPLVAVFLLLSDNL